MNAPFDENSANASFTPRNGEVLAPELLSRTARDRDDTLWTTLRAEAVQECIGERALRRLYASVLQAKSFEEALILRLSVRLDHPSLPTDALRPILLESILADASIGQICPRSWSAIRLPAVFWNPSFSSKATPRFKPTASRIGIGMEENGTSLSICRAGHPRFSRPTYIRARNSAKAYSSTMQQALWQARRL